MDKKYAELKKKHDILLSKYNKAVSEYNKGWDSFVDGFDKSYESSQDYVDGYRSRLVSEFETKLRDLLCELKLRSSVLSIDKNDKFVSREVFDNMKRELSSEINKCREELSSIRSVEEEMVSYIRDLNNVITEKEKLISSLMVEKDFLSNKCSFYDDMFKRLFVDSSIFEIFLKALEDLEFLNMVTKKFGLKESFLLYLKDLCVE